MRTDTVWIKKNISSSRLLWPVLILVCIICSSVILFPVFPGQISTITDSKKSIAVVPFVITDTVKENNYISDGITGEIVLRLSGISGLHVVSTYQLKAVNYKNLSPTQIAAIFHVTSILRGQISKDGKNLHIIVQLIDAVSGKEIWTRNFEASLDDLFSFQNELAQVVAEELQSKLTEEEKKRLSFRPTQNLEAYDQYLKGVYYWNQRDRISLAKGVGFFKNAIAIDSNYAKAWSGLADCFSALGYGSNDLPAADFLQAEKAANRALLLDSSLAEPHTSLGYIYFYYYWNWGKAENEFLHAIQLNPDYPLAHDAYVYLLTARERYAEASLEMEKALNLDPSSAYIQTDKGFSLYYARHYNQAIAALMDVHIRYPEYPLSWLWLGRAYQEKKNILNA